MSEIASTSSSSSSSSTAAASRTPSSSTFGLRLFLAILIALIASRLIPFHDFLFAFLASLYIYLMSLSVFPPVTASVPPTLFPGNKLLKKYVMFAALVGVFLPLAFVLLGLLLGNKMAVKPAARHTFLLVCQIVSEQVTARSNAFSLPGRGLVPILYNSSRLVWIWGWMQAHVGDSGSAKQWAVWGGILAVANMMLWFYNLFGFLLPVFLPRCMRKYYEDEKIWKGLKGPEKASND